MAKCFHIYKQISFAFRLLPMQKKQLQLIVLNLVCDPESIWCHFQQLLITHSSLKYIQLSPVLKKPLDAMLATVFIAFRLWSFITFIVMMKNEMDSNLTSVQFKDYTYNMHLLQARRVSLLLVRATSHLRFPGSNPGGT